MFIDELDKELKYYEEIYSKINEECRNHIRDCNNCQEVYKTNYCPVGIINEFIFYLKKIKCNKEEVDYLVKVIKNINL